MRVTNIKQQVKRANRYSIFLDNKYAFSLSELDLVELRLKVGQDIAPDDLEKVNSKVEYSNARNASFRLLSYRARSTAEIKEYLIRKKYEPEIIEGTIDYLTSKGFLDDEAFARQWVDNRVANKKTSIRQIKNELRKKKVSNDIIDLVLEDESIDELGLLKELIDKKRGQPKYRDDLKLMQYLARRGFAYDKILVALGRRTE